MNTDLSKASITAFITDLGVDLVFRANLDDRSGDKRARAVYGKLNTSLDGIVTRVKFTDKDDELVVKFGERIVTLRQQKAGHFFGWLNEMPKAQPIDLATARKLQAEASKPAK